MNDYLCKYLYKSGECAFLIVVDFIFWGIMYNFITLQYREKWVFLVLVYVLSCENIKFIPLWEEQCK